jgi:RNA polymerase sigma-70 factor (ECF subfamily)
VAENEDVGDASAELCRRIAEGDQLAEELLIGRLQPGLNLVLHRATHRDSELARELCQETLIIVLERLRTSGLHDPSALPAFAAQTARNLAIASRRKSRRRRTEPDTEALDRVQDIHQDQYSLLSSRRLGQLVRRLIAQLPTDRDRLVLTRFYLHEDDKGAICRDLRISGPTFDQALFRARKRFKQLIGAAGISRDALLDSELVE